MDRFVRDRTRKKYVRGRLVEEFHIAGITQVFINWKRVQMTYDQAVKYVKTMKPIPNKPHK